MNEWIQVFGRFHPLLLHMPIGLLGAVAAVEGVTLLRRDLAWVSVARFLAVLAAAAAVATAGTGYVLGLSGEYAGETVDLHRNLGIAVAIAAVLTAVTYFHSSALPRRIALALCMAMLLPAGHLGATLTHGENFLFAPLEKNPSKRTIRTPVERLNTDIEAPPATSSEIGSTPSIAPTQFSTVIAPIFAARCISCHGPSKQKGELVLHTAEGILKGGEFGPVVVPGNAKESELIRRMRLPIGDEDRMPPAAKPQPTEQEIAAIEAWITSGASFTSAPTNASPISDQNPVPEPRKSETPKEAKPAESGPSNSGAETSSVKPAPDSAIAALRAHLVHVAPVAQSSEFLVVDTAAVAPQFDDALAQELLTPIRSNLADLSLARTKITDNSVAFLSAMPHLRRLDLRGTPVSPEGLKVLSKSVSIEELVLSQTRADDSVLQEIAAIPSLRRLFLWKSGVTQDAVDRLRAEKPKLFVDAGDRSTTAVASRETEVKLTNDAPPFGQAAAVSRTPDLTPINTVCPVSGSPVVAKYSIVYNGRIIGFCCPNCPKEFWADPAKFEGKLR